MTDLTGKAAVVTGAGRGIGQAVAIRQGRLGASAMVNYARGASGAAATVAAIEDAGPKAIAVQAYVPKPDDIEALLDTARSRFGRLDIVMANAGLDEGLGPVLDVTEAEYDSSTSAPVPPSTLHPPPDRRLRPLHLQQAARELPGRNACPGDRRTRGHGQRSRSDRDGRRGLLHREQGRRPAPPARAERQPPRLAQGNGRRRRGRSRVLHRQAGPPLRREGSGHAATVGRSERRPTSASRLRPKVGKHAGDRRLRHPEQRGRLP
ncbi:MULTISPECIES: SDR family NAD(P)-dependent oxidoreductase [unclassified Streptomyces]|uniref:SDR family NAD(P)-dependent oxidoreductase n=1 Tax=unclassified Streptomyces TaxID=2593676 RepID=UPI00371209A9